MPIQRDHGNSFDYGKPAASITELEEMTREYEELAAAGAPFELLITKAEAVHWSANYRIRSAGLKPPYTFTRARKVAPKPHYISEIAYPPAKYVNVPGRVNEKNESMFYACVGWQEPTALLECGAKVEDKFIFSDWQSTELLNFNHLGFSASSLEGLAAKRGFHPGVFPDSNTESAFFLSEWQAKVFTRRVEEGREHEYRACIGLAKWALSSTDFDGLLYPSIAFNAHSDNVAIKPDRVDAKLRLRYARYQRIQKATEQTQHYGTVWFESEGIDECGPPDNSGRLRWWKDSKPTGFYL